MHNFHKNTIQEKQKIVAEFCGLSKSDIRVLNTPDPDQYNKLIENVIGTYVLPLGVATNFTINSKKYFIPMVTEEPSIVAAASSGAKAVIDNITTISYGPHVIGQLQIMSPDSDTEYKINKSMKKIKDKVNEYLSKHMKCLDVAYENISKANMSKLEIVIDTGEAMGANAVNTVCEGIAPLIEEITNKQVLLKILANAKPRMGYARAYFDVEPKIAKNIVAAYQFALHDSNRAITHNKGIMNGVIAVATATGQDTRAIESAAHAYAVKNGVYKPLTKWEIENGKLFGSIKIPLAVGVIGGLTKHHGTASIALKVLGNPNANELTGIMAAVGLCQNFSALRALVKDGIQKGHMKLHSRRQ